MIPRDLVAVAPTLLLALLTLTACGGEAVSRPGADVTDSAGVRVVVNPPPVAEPDPTWSLAAEPDVEVGVLEGQPEYQLYQVSGGAVLSDGTLVVANRGTHELRFYDAQGRHLRSVGGEGDGPGEFRSLQLVGRFGGDSLLTFDFRQRRASVFTPEGGFVRSFRLGEESEMSFPTPQGVLSSGDLLVRQGSVYMAGEVTTGADRSPERLFLAGPEGAVVDSLGEFPGSESFVLAEGSSMAVRSLTFGRALSMAAVGDRMAVGNSDAYSVRVYGADGSLLHVVRQQRDAVPVQDEDFRRYAESALADIDNDDWRRRSREMLEKMPRHETFPAYNSLELDRDGHLWIQEYRRPGDEQPVWQVFDRDGVFAARMETPPGLRFLEIGEDYVLGVVRDDLDVERVRLYRLEKS